jgi:hypothetical protein
MASLSMRVPEFPEAQHPLIQALSSQSDRELVCGFQQHQEKGQFFVAIFCRYAGLSYVLIRNMARAALQTDYLFARVWRNIFFELTYLDAGESPDGADDFSLQTWIFNKTALCINQEEAPSIESVQYALDIASPPLWCYLQIALDHVPPLQRLVLVLSQTFHWSDIRIAGFLQSEGESIEREALPQIKAEAYEVLTQTLPEDIKTIYFMPQSANKSGLGPEATVIEH